ncbi:MAG: NADH-quinone oxidoreductase subunit NuoG [Acidobacteriota bacterium]|jgi:NADH-quinone oxidoreductase subunit G
MAKILIDGREYEIDEGRNVLQAALDLKLDLPYFCWHPAMGSVGACRLCAVKHYRDENDENGRLTMGCMTPATDGTRVAIEDPEAQQFRRSVIEWLMINHPHDCPVCDEGGECHLQDMTVMTGHAHRRYRGSKRTYRNQYLGPLIHHEMNRCIQCYRCTRFYRDHSGGDDLGAFGSRNRMYFGRVEEGVLESPFAGNLVEVCPTGVFTDKTLRRHFTRKWDLQSAPSVCTHCSLGCNTIMGARYGSVRRVTTRYNGEVNGYWLCDRGRFGYEHLNAPDRLLRPQTPRQPGAAADPADIWHEAAAAVTAAAGNSTLAAVGSPRTSLESNYALRVLAGAQRFCAGLATREREIVARWAAAARAGAFRVPSLQHIERADAIVVIGVDLTNEAPLLDLAAYRARANGAAIHLIGLSHGRVAGFAATVGGESPRRFAPPAARQQITRLARALRHETDLKVEGMQHIEAAAQALAGAHDPLVITGTQHRDPGLLDAVLDLTDAMGAAAGTAAWCALAPAEANALGVTLLDGGDGADIEEIVAAIESGAVDTLVVAENDLFTRYEDHPRLDAALQRLSALVVIDHMVTATAGVATHTLPATATAECNGTLVNNEGRMQRFYEVVRPRDGVRPTWSLARDLMPASHAVDWRHFGDVTAAIEADFEIFTGINAAAPPAGYRHAHQPVPRMSHRYSGRNATLQRDALEGLAAAGPDGELPVAQHISADAETPLAFTMEGYPGEPPPALLPRVWAPGWNSNEAINQFQIEVGGPLHGGDPGRRIFAADLAGFGNGAAGESRGAASDAPSGRAPDAGAPEPDRLLVCATAEIFGSEPMARRAQALAELTPDTCLRLHPGRAAALGLEHGEVRRLRLSGEGIETVLEALVEADPTLPEHVATIPAGDPATGWWQRPLWLRIEASEVT